LPLAPALNRSKAGFCNISILEGGFCKVAVCVGGEGKMPFINLIHCRWRKASGGDLDIQTDTKRLS
jgi:hypothetical protein